jgi:hypothetical protein
MSASYPSSDLASYRDSVTQLVEAGEEFGDIEYAIDAVPDLSEDQKAALWLLAFSMRDPGEQQRDAQSYLSFVS